MAAREVAAVEHEAEGEAPTIHELRLPERRTRRRAGEEKPADRDKRRYTRGQELAAALSLYL